MLGPELDAPGGIASLARRLLARAGEVELRYLATVGQGTRPAKAAFGARALARFPGLLRSFRPDVVHIHVGDGPSVLRKSAFAALAATARIPVVVHGHFARPAALLTGGRGPVTRSLLGEADAVVLLGRAQIDALQPALRRPAHLLLNGVPTERFVPLGPALHREPVVLFVGGGERRKGGRELLAAMPAVRAAGPVRLRLAGPDLQALGPVEDDVALLGHLDEDRMLAELQDADVFCLPSHAEGLPVALLEAMACGLPCVASAVDGVPDAIEHDVTGLLVPPQDADALGEALVRLMREPATRARLGGAARVRVQADFDEGRLWDQLVALWWELSSRASSRRNATSSTR